MCTYPAQFPKLMYSCLQISLDLPLILFSQQLSFLNEGGRRYVVGKKNKTQQSSLTVLSDSQNVCRFWSASRHVFFSFFLLFEYRPYFIRFSFSYLFLWLELNIKCGMYLKLDLKIKRNIWRVRWYSFFLFCHKMLSTPVQLLVNENI